MMKKICLIVLAFLHLLGVQGKDTLNVKEPQTPILVNREDNVLFELRLDADKVQTLDEILLNFTTNTPIKSIKAVKLYYSGTEAHQKISPNRFAPLNYLPMNDAKWSRKANPSYSVLKSQVTPSAHQIKLEAGQPLVKGINYFWISIEMYAHASLDDKITLNHFTATADGKLLPINKVTPAQIPHRLAMGLRQAGDDQSASFRIPGLATTKKGTLLAVYDVRYNSSVDLQEHIVIGLSRSTDGGKTWEKMRIPLDMTKSDRIGLPPAQNGVGDPCILVDEKTGDIYIAALWTHGMGNQRAWHTSQQGMSVEKTGQLVLTKSIDDGKSWSQPVNITPQVKQDEWFLLLQGPGKGITMHDGTLVFPIQFIGKDRIPSAGIMYSKDKGASWHIHNAARSNTTEAQVVEIESGVLMLNMRDNRGGSRAIYTTNDLGRNWTEHPSSRNLLIEPVCMASLIKIESENSPNQKEILLFSNPNHTQQRINMTIKASLDKGKSWPASYQLLLDENEGWGYSCMTPIDKNTIGILYESSVANIIFQRIKLSDLIHE